MCKKTVNKVILLKVNFNQGCLHGCTGEVGGTLASSHLHTFYVKMYYLILMESLQIYLKVLCTHFCDIESFNMI